MSSGWTPAKVAAFRSAFADFLKCVFIDSKEKGRYRLSDGLYDAQNRLLDGVFDGLSLDIHDFKVLKSRQLGISTIVQALFVFFLGMIDGIKAVVLFDTAPHIKRVRTEVVALIKRLPASLKYPGIVGDSREMLQLANGNTVEWLAAGVRETESSGNLGRGSGYNLVWASEVSSYKNEEGLQSFIETLAESFENRLFLWESTARGYNHWRDMVVEAKGDDLNQRMIFIGWWAHPLHLIRRTDRRFERYGKTEPTKAESETISLVSALYNHQITPEQLAWYRWKIDPTREAEAGEKKSGQFKIQEQPSVEEECFTQAGSSFFDHKSLNAQRIRLIAFPRPTGHRYIFGPEFPNTIITPAIYAREVQLRVWDEPDPSLKYIVAADPAFGRNPDNDRSACQVIACYADCIEQVAEFASPVVNTSEFAWVIASLAAWYKNCGVIIELDGPGEAVWKEYEGLPALLRSKYMRHVAEARGLTDVFNNVRSYIFQRPDSMSGRGNNWHWKTGNRKEAIMEKLKVFTNSGQAIIKSPDTIEEMRTVARDGASIEAPSHKHDDRTVALAIALRAWEDEFRQGLITQGFTRESYLHAKKLTSPAKYTIYMQNQISNLFHRSAQVAKQQARAAKQAQLQARRR